MSPVDFINADCQGYLLKLDGRSKCWKTRFCLLSDAFLYLYVDKESESALGNFKTFFSYQNNYLLLIPFVHSSIFQLFGLRKHILSQWRQQCGCHGCLGTVEWVPGTRPLTKIWVPKRPYFLKNFKILVILSVTYL